MKELIHRFQKNQKDTGSSEVQIISATYRIKIISEHIKTHPKDFHCRRGLMVEISKRKSLLAYLKRKDTKSYQDIIQALGLRR